MAWVCNFWFCTQVNFSIPFVTSFYPSKRVLNIFTDFIHDEIIFKHDISMLLVLLLFFQIFSLWNEIWQCFIQCLWHCRFFLVFNETEISSYWKQCYLLAALEIVILTTFGAASDDNFVNITIFPPQFCIPWFVPLTVTVFFIPVLAILIFLYYFVEFLSRRWFWVPFTWI